MSGQGTIVQTERQQTEAQIVNNTNPTGATDTKCDFYLIFDANNGFYNENITADIKNGITAITGFNTVMEFKGGDTNYKLVALEYSPNNESNKVTGITPTDISKIGKYFEKFFENMNQTAFIRQRLAECLKSTSSGGNRFAKTIRSKNITHWRRNKSNRNRRQNKRI